MRRAAILFLTACLLATRSARAESQVERAPNMIDGAGFVNYMQRPSFTVGEWVKYRTSGHSLRGYKDDYSVTILVAGEEVFWGEPCVWIETWTEQADGGRKATASLVSYAAFGDTMSARHLMWFVRKTINGMLGDGQPEYSLITRDRNELRLRRVNWEQDVDPTKVDTLGADTTTVRAGSFKVLRVKREVTHAEAADQGDSTMYYDRRTTRIFSYSPNIPITSLAKVEIDDEQRGKNWLVGHFDKRPYNTLERAQGTTELIGYGKSGLKPLMVPEALRHPISRKLVEEALSMPQLPPVIEASKHVGS